MLKIMGYIIKKEYKVYFTCLFIALFFGSIIRIDIIKIPKSIEDNYDGFMGLLLFVIAIFLLERLAWYIERGLIYDYREFFLAIPYSVTDYINAVVMMHILEITLFYLTLNILMKQGILYVIRDLSLLISLLLGIGFFAFYILAKASLYLKNRISGSIFLGFFTVLSIVVYFFLVNVLKVRIPFLYNYYVGFISLCLLFFSVGYFGLNRQYSNEKLGNKLYQKITLVCILSTLCIYCIGQYYTYSIG